MEEFLESRIKHRYPAGMIIKPHEKPLAFVFIDESGVHHQDPNQPFFAVGALTIEDTSKIVQDLANVRRRAISATGRSGGNFEFKFKEITRVSRPFYEELIFLAVRFRPRISVSVIDKDSSGEAYRRRFPYTWDAYVEMAKIVIGEAVKPGAECVIIADFARKPHNSNLWLERELRSLPQVRNATMLESHASLMIQLIDVMTGCIVYQFRMGKDPAAGKDPEKLRVSNMLAEKLNLTSLAGDFQVDDPFPMQVWKYEP